MAMYEKETAGAWTANALFDKNLVYLIKDWITKTRKHEERAKEFFLSDDFWD
jgi:hypothetical protein